MGRRIKLEWNKSAIGRISDCCIFALGLLLAMSTHVFLWLDWKGWPSICIIRAFLLNRGYLIKPRVWLGLMALCWRPMCQVQGHKSVQVFDGVVSSCQVTNWHGQPHVAKDRNRIGHNALPASAAIRSLRWMGHVPGSRFDPKDCTESLYRAISS